VSTISLVISTYQARKIIVVRRDGDVLNTHFFTFAKPMGIAADRARLRLEFAHPASYILKRAGITRGGYRPKCRQALLT